MAEPLAVAHSSTIADRLSAGQKALRRIRIRFSGTALGLAALLFLIWIPFQKVHLYQALCRRDWVAQLSGLEWVCDDVSFVLALMAPLPNDKKVTLLVLIVNGLRTLQFAWVRMDLALECLDESARLKCANFTIVNPSWCLVNHITILCGDLAFSLVAIVAIALGVLGSPVARVQDLMWKGATAYFLAPCLLLVPILTLVVAWHKEVAVATWNMLLNFVWLFLCRSRTRSCFHLWLQRLYTSRRESYAAAGVAGLVGDCCVQEALSLAKQRFRCVSADRLKYEALLTNTAAAELNQAAERARLGECDAFLSHSWHDQPEAKWAALQQWRRAFGQREAREPLVWFDKYCVDQNNIENDLRVLPIFLSGCKELVLLIGPTYLRRLWCVIELFTFVHMGGDTRRIVVVPALRGGREEEDWQQIQAEVETFAAERCACSVPAEKDKMLRIIHSAFGSIGEFDKYVRSILNATSLHHPGFLLAASAEHSEDGAGDGVLPRPSSQATGLDEEAGSSPRAVEGP